MESVDIAEPDPGPAMRELGQILQGRTAQGQQVLALEIALGPFAGDGGHVLGAMLRQGGFRAPYPLALVRGLEAASDNPDALAIEEQRPRNADRLRRHRVRVGVVQDLGGGPDDDRHAQQTQLLSGQPSAMASEPALTLMLPASEWTEAAEVMVMVPPLARLTGPGAVTGPSISMSTSAESRTASPEATDPTLKLCPSGPFSAMP